MFCMQISDAKPGTLRRGTGEALRILLRRLISVQTHCLQPHCDLLPAYALSSHARQRKRSLCCLCQGQCFNFVGAHAKLPDLRPVLGHARTEGRLGALSGSSFTYQEMLCGARNEISVDSGLPGVSRVLQPPTPGKRTCPGSNESRLPGIQSLPRGRRANLGNFFRC